jgi:FtsP/CotA-like multicopper oxidase with cupredoxin domain
MNGHAVSSRAGQAVNMLACVSLAVAALLTTVLPGAAQSAPPCPVPAYANPGTEIVTNGGVLRGTINLTEQFIAMPQPGDTNCSQRPSQIVRIFKGYQGAIDPPMPPPNQPPALSPVAPGPTLRARLGDVVQLSFINQVNQNNFDEDLDIEKCTTVGQGGATYPKRAGDVFPDCLHASSTANIHFHGTHTSPKSTGDNVYLMVRPLPRDRLGNETTPARAVTQSFDEFFDLCARVLKENPLRQWPTSWNDLPAAYTGMERDLLQKYQAANPSQPLWDENENAMKQGVWPQYYIGAFPYCFALPEYTAQTWPAPAGSPRMGQSPGTHWYHAHKHGSTAINVGNGMVGAFIIEGPSYDGALNSFYGRWQVDGQFWNTRNQKVMVLNQLQTVPNRLAGAGGPAPDFVVNGLRQPQVTMRPGEVQLWRIVNGAGRSAAFFQAPNGLQWRQIAQDGVQFANQNYLASENRAIYVAPGNRIDLLVQAPTTPTPPNQPFDVRIQNVMARGAVKPIPVKLTADDPDPSVSLFTVTVTGAPVTPSAMPFIPQAPQQPAFLADITNSELSPPSPGTSPMVFNSNGPRRQNPPKQHTINNQQFSTVGDIALVNVPLNVAQEWTIQNTTNVNGPGLIDHPFHIHVNPFQITQVFDPNQLFLDQRGEPIGVLVPTLNGNKQIVQTTVAVPVYVLNATDQISSAQCVLDPQNPATWVPCVNSQQSVGPTTNLIWWDVFAIPSGRPAPTAANPNNVIPGLFKMRSRFVDYQGLYVLHCHILIHEDRGMMFRVNVGNDPSVTVLQHH